MSSDFSARIGRIADRTTEQVAADRAANRVVDTRDGTRYVVWDDRITTAVEVAIATGRPLLVRGPAGAGKSLLAHKIASDLDRGCVTEFVTATTEARDLLWRIDHVRRFHDANTLPAGHFSSALAPYVEPGVLWWAFDEASARRRGAADGEVPPASSPDGHRAGSPSVVLLDEIDKAEPDMPNSLLDPLGSLSFIVTDLGLRVEAAGSMSPIVVITSNDERDLSPPFLRRCVHLDLQLPGNDHLIDIGRRHFGSARELEALMREVLEALQPEGWIDRANADDGRASRRISPARFIDVLRAVRVADIKVDDRRWRQLVAMLGATESHD